MNKSNFFHIINPSNLTEIKKEENGCEVPKEDIRFYSKRIVMLTNKLLNGGFSKNENIDYSFQVYLSQCIEYFKFIDKQELIQNKIFVESKTQPLNIKQSFLNNGGSNTNNNMNNINDIITNNLEKKQVKTITMNKFIKTNKVKKKQKQTFPKIQTYNLKKSNFKEKGLHKKKSN